MKKLKLNRETVKTLTARELQNVHGGEIASAGDPECLATQIQCPTPRSLMTICAACRPW